MPKQGLVCALLTTVAFTSIVACAESHVLLRPEVSFQPLNPARGDASPRAGVLWGDIEKDVASGAIIEFAPNFSSPPHIHNITYRGVVISGVVHNDDPEAAYQWMGPGSFWVQPAGEPHITAAGDGRPATIFLEIFEGPYLVKPIDAAFDNGERPLNVDARNHVWLGSADTNWIDDNSDATAEPKAEIAFLWGVPRPRSPNGTLLRLQAGNSGRLGSNKSPLKAVAISGDLSLASETDADQILPTGSYFTIGDQAKTIACKSDDSCVLYVTAKGAYRFSLN